MNARPTQRGGAGRELPGPAIPGDRRAGVVFLPPVLGRCPPRWDARALELWWAGRVIKRLRHVAGNQCAVLEGLEAEGWPTRIDDPMVRVAGRNAKNRRRETIKSLNLGLAPATIRFHSDGTGGGVRWEIIV